MSIIAETPPRPQAPPVAVVGIDTHRDTHTLTMLSLVGVVLGTLVIDNTTAGFKIAINWIRDLTDGPVRIGMEGTRSYGIGLMRALTCVGIEVLEVEQPSRKQRRGRGKSDEIDAVLAARCVLAGRGHQPRTDGDREALRILLAAREAMNTVHTASINQLKALLRCGDDADRDLARRAFTWTVLHPLTQLQTRPDQDPLTRITIKEITRLATTIIDHEQQLHDNRAELDTLIRNGPHRRILELLGVGPVTAARIIVAWSHPGRCRNDAAFAALAGVNPVPASSGNTTRHRLNRGGDRHLNRALHTIALTRWRACARTKDYTAKRRAQGMSDSDIRRVLKRYIAREVFKILDNAA